eukprot:Pgem_evm1s700
MISQKAKYIGWAIIENVLIANSIIQFGKYHGWYILENVVILCGVIRSSFSDNAINIISENWNIIENLGETNKYFLNVIIRNGRIQGWFVIEKIVMLLGSLVDSLVESLVNGFELFNVLMQSGAEKH